MNSLVLLVERGSRWSPESWATEHDGRRSIAGCITIDRESEWLSVCRDDRVLDEFDDDERARLVKLVTEPIAYLIEWRGGALVESLLRSVPIKTQVAVDNDHGLLVSVNEVAGKSLDSWVRASTLPWSACGQ